MSVMLILPVVRVCRYLVEPFVQGQPEAETGQRDAPRVDREDPHPSVQQGGHFAHPLRGRDLSQHHRLPQVLNTQRYSNLFLLVFAFLLSFLRPRFGKPVPTCDTPTVGGLNTPSHGHC